jgi:hypothetical protein
MAAASNDWQDIGRAPWSCRGQRDLVRALCSDCSLRRIHLEELAEETERSRLRRNSSEQLRTRTWVSPQRGKSTNFRYQDWQAAGCVELAEADRNSP